MDAPITLSSRSVFRTRWQNTVAPFLLFLAQEHRNRAPRAVSPHRKHNIPIGEIDIIMGLARMGVL
jgi:hypothetical protein